MCLENVELHFWIAVAVIADSGLLTISRERGLHEMTWTVVVEVESETGGCDIKTSFSATGTCVSFLGTHLHGLARCSY